MWARAAMAASIGVFVFAFYNFPSIAFGQIFTTETRLALSAAPIKICYHSNRIQNCGVVHDSFLPTNALIGYSTIEREYFFFAAVEHNIECLFEWKTPISWDFFAKIQNNFCTSNLNDGSAPVACIMGYKHNIKIIPGGNRRSAQKIEGASNDLRPMSSVKFVASKFDTFIDKPRLAPSDDCQDHREKRDDQRRNGSQIIWVFDPIEKCTHPRHHVALYWFPWGILGAILGGLLLGALAAWSLR